MHVVDLNSMTFGEISRLRQENGCCNWKKAQFSISVMPVKSAEKYAETGFSSKLRSKEKMIVSLKTLFTYLKSNRSYPSYCVRLVVPLKYRN